MATKLPSGNYRTTVFVGYKDGKRIYENFVADTADEADYAALEFKLKNKRNKLPKSVTLGEAIDGFIESKSNILSPKTIKEYKHLRQSAYGSLVDMPISRVNREVVQRWVNEYSRTRAYNTIKNAYAVLNSSIKFCNPDYSIHIELPRKAKTKIEIPTDEEIKKLVSYVTDTNMELPVLFAAFMSLRRSEVCGLRYSDVDYKNGTMTVARAMVANEHNEYVIKGTKTGSSERIVEVPDFILERIKHYQQGKKQDDYIVEVIPQYITKKMKGVCSGAGVQMYTYHQLRHYFVSKLHALGIPDLYAIELTGHSTTHTLKRVYQHIIEEKNKEVRNTVKTELNNFMQHNLQHG